MSFTNGIINNPAPVYDSHPYANEKSYFPNPQPVYNNQLSANVNPQQFIPAPPAMPNPEPVYNGQPYTNEKLFPPNPPQFIPAPPAAPVTPNKDLENNTVPGRTTAWYHVGSWSKKKRFLVFGGILLVLIAIIVGAAVGATRASASSTSFCGQHPEAASCGGCESIAGGIYC